ncbi:GATOR2 complex protein WDR24-like [Liolophura sinensis]|uniref:GATOR2 complex protein WDR24-like n=1 Tax=Liolophura sinensis TaxID=3198878 RepID=UPI003158272E
MSVKNRGPRRFARPGDGSADVNNLSHQLEGLSLSDPKKDKTKTEPQREVMQQENTKSMASHTSGDVRHHTCSSRDLKSERHSCTKEDSEGMETLQTKQDGRTVPNNNEDEHVSSKKDDPVSSKKDDPVSSKKDDPVANNNKDNPVANNNRDDPVSRNMSFPVANNNRNNPGPCITDDAVANNEKEEMANSSRRPGDPDEESSCTEKWEMNLTVCYNAVLCYVIC